MTQLTRTGWDNREPVVSRNGTSIAWVADGAILSMNSDGSDQHILIAKSSADLGRPAWSSDGNTIAFREVEDAVRYTGYAGRIGVLDIVSGKISTVTPDSRSDYYYLADDLHSPAFSPDGASLAMIARYVPCPSFVSTDDSACDALLVADANGSAPHAVIAFPTDDACSSGAPDCPPPTSQTGPIGELAWSPDSTRLAFTLPTRGFGATDIFIVNSDGSGLRDLPTVRRSSSIIATRQPPRTSETTAYRPISGQ